MFRAGMILIYMCAVWETNPEQKKNKLWYMKKNSFLIYFEASSLFSNNESRTELFIGFNFQQQYAKFLSIPELVWVFREIEGI